MEKIKIGVSSCLLGKNVRYDGGHRRDAYIVDVLGKHFEWIHVCPEVEYGLPIPREVMQLVGDPASPRLVTVYTHIDHTEGMKKWARNKLDQLLQEGLCGFIFKSRSPSCGISGIPIFDESGIQTGSGTGIFAKAFMEEFPLIPIEDEVGLSDPAVRENFIERVSFFRRNHDS